MAIDTKRLRRIGHAVGLELGHDAGERINVAADALDAQAAEIARLREALRKAAQLTEICTDWNLDEVEIDGEMVWTHELGAEFRAALAQEQKS